MPAPKFRKPYTRQRHALSFLDENGEPQPSKTEQHHAKSCDINNVIRQYDRTGVLEHVNQAQATYGDFTEINEYQTNLNMVIQAQNTFEALPATVRARFSNDPGEYIEFVTNPANRDEIARLGLLKEVPTPEIPPEIEPAPAPIPE